MANTYHKILTNKTAMDFTKNLIGDIQNDLVKSLNVNNETLLDMLNKTSNIDINTLLKYYTINSIMKQSQTVEKETKQVSKFVATANPNYKKSVEDNSYYRLTDEGTLKIDKKVICVYDDGSYKKAEPQVTSRYIVEKTYSVEDSVQFIQLVGPDGRVLTNKAQIAQILEMRKEFAQRFKYSGFSGNSRDIVATLCNKFCSPVETGYYMDKNFQLFKWSETNNCFVRNTQFEMTSPLLTDYEFVNGQKVVKKEYIGA